MIRILFLSGTLLLLNTLKTSQNSIIIQKIKSSFQVFCIQMFSLYLNNHWDAFFQSIIHNFNNGSYSWIISGLKKLNILYFIHFLFASVTCGLNFKIVNLALKMIMKYYPHSIMYSIDASYRSEL